MFSSFEFEFPEVASNIDKCEFTVVRLYHQTSSDVLAEDDSPLVPAHLDPGAC